MEKTGKQIKTILEYIRIFITVFLPDIAKIFVDRHIDSFEGPKIKFLNKKKKNLISFKSAALPV